MSIRVFLLLFAGFLVVPCARGQTGRSDALGDPLPEGAVARLGTLRLKHSFYPNIFISAFVFSPDGKRFVSLDQWPWPGDFHLWETASGKEIRGPWTGSPPMASAFSPDGTILATVFRSKGVPMVRLYNLASAKLAKEIPVKDQAGALQFAEGGQTLVLAGLGRVSWWDIATGNEKRFWRPFGEEKHPPGATAFIKIFDQCAISPNARSIAVHVTMLYGLVSHKDHEVCGFDLASGKMTWHARRKYNQDHRSPFAFSADSKRVLIAVGPDMVEVRSTATGKLIGPSLSRKFTEANWVGSVALSSDGKTAALAGDNGKIVLWNPDTPTTPRRFLVGNPPSSARCLQFSTDNKTLLAGINADIQLYDVGTLREVFPWQGHRDAITFLAFSRDGKRLVTGYGGTGLRPEEMAAWDRATWKLLQRTSARRLPWPGVGAVSPDQLVYSGSNGEDTFGLFNVATGKLLSRMHMPGKEPAEVDGFFSPSGKHYVLKRRMGKSYDTVGIFSVPSGKLLSLLPPAAVAEITRADGQPTFSYDEKLLALFGRGDGKIHLYETVTGELRRKLSEGWGKQPPEIRDSILAQLAFSPDGKRLASRITFDDAIRVWDVATGRQLQIIMTKQLEDKDLQNLLGELYRFRFAWSPDNRILAVSDGGLPLTKTGRLWLWELASGQVRHEWTRDGDSIVRCLAFSPDGRSLASGSIYSTVLVWDTSMPGLGGKATPARDSRDLARGWERLAQADPKAAFAAIRNLVAAPAESVAWIRTHLPPAEKIDSKRIEHLIAEVDNPHFQVREQATAELMRIGDFGVQAIDKVLAGNPSLETRRRLETVRQRIANLILTGKRLQAYRAIEVLEHIGSPAARQLLRDLAQGEAGALVTTQAHQALERLTK